MEIKNVWNHRSCRSHRVGAWNHHLEKDFKTSRWHAGSPNHDAWSADTSIVGCVRQFYHLMYIYIYTLQGINISHLGKRKIIFKMPFLGNMLVPWRVYNLFVPSLYRNIRLILPSVLFFSYRPFLSSSTRSCIHLFLFNYREIRIFCSISFSSLPSDCCFILIYSTSCSPSNDNKMYTLKQRTKCTQLMVIWWFGARWFGIRFSRYP